MPLQIPVTQTGLEASIQQAMKNAGRNAQINLGTNSRQINALAQPLGRITGQADEFTKSMEAANARVFAFGASVGIINGVSNAFGALIKNTIEVEKSLVEINSVLNTSQDSLQKFGNKLFDVAKTTGQTFDIVAKGALELARQGLSTEETLKRINDALILSRLSGLDAQQSVEGLTAAFNSFKETGITTSQILNKLVVVSQKYSVSEKDLIEALKRSASVADQAGVSFDELVGIVTTVQERTARGGAVIGNAFKTIFARIQDTGALQDLANLGIQVTDLEGKVLPATRILQNLGAEFNNLSQLEQADIAKKLGGVYQLSNLLAAVKDLSSEQSKYNDIVELSASATNEAYQKNAALNETLAALINKVSVSAQQLGATLGKIGITDSLKSLLAFFNNILEGIQNILGEESALGTFVKGLAKGIGNVLAGPGLALFGAIIAKLSKDLISFGLESLKSFFKIGQAAKDIASVEKSIAAALGSNLTLQKQLFALEGNRAAQIKLMTDAIVQQEAVMRRMASTAGSLAGPLYQQGVRSTGGQGLRVPKAAGGYMPAVSQETRDISRGVGGAKAGDKPVIIPNFAFGGGKKGTMVAHTGEYIVPNFAGGGSAIFNRDMVRSMGLPAGAKKIGAAGGFIPNFAEWYNRDTTKVKTSTSMPTTPGDWIKVKSSSESIRKYSENIDQYRVRDTDFYLFPDGTGSRGNTVRDTLSREESKAVTNIKQQKQKISEAGEFEINANALGGIAVVSPRFGSGVRELSATGLIANYAAFNQGGPNANIDKNKYITLKGIKGVNTPKPQDVKGLSVDINQLFADRIVDLAYKLYGGTFDSASAGEFGQKLKSLSGKRALLPPTAEGQIFEAAGKVALNSIENLESLFGSEEQNRPFDFQNPKAIQQMFGLNVLRGDAKRGGEDKFVDKDGKMAVSSKGQDMIRKSLNDPEYSSKMLSILKSQGAFSPEMQRKKSNEEVSNAINGFIPNFSKRIPEKIRAGRDFESDVFTKLKLGNPGNRILDIPQGLLQGKREEAKTSMGLEGSFGDVKLSNAKTNKYNFLGKLIKYFNLANYVTSAFKDKGQKEVLLNKKIPSINDATMFFSGNPSLYYPEEVSATLGQILHESRGLDGVQSPVLEAFKSARTKPGDPSSVALQDAFKRKKIIAKINMDGINPYQNTLNDKDPFAKGYIPNFVSQKYVMDTLARIKAGTSGFSKQEQETFLSKFGAKSTGRKISLREVYDKLDGDVGVSALIDKAYMAAGPTASNEDVYRIFEKQIKANPYALRSVVSKKGFVPNFADPLKEAIGREMSAGVPASQIYVDQNSSLKNSMNPMGLMVANRRDEPAGGMQGINRARKEGANPMTYGAAGGFIPNFQRRVGAGGGSSDNGEPVRRDLLGIIFAVQTGLSLLTGATADSTNAFAKAGNVLTSMASSGTSVFLLFQGLSGIAKQGSFASLALGKLGMVAGVAAAAYEGFKIFGNYQNENNVAMNQASLALEEFSKAASKATFNLGNLSPEQRKQTEKRGKDLLEGAIRVDISKATGRPELNSLSADMNTRLAKDKSGKTYYEMTSSFEGFNDKLKQQLQEITNEALGAGIKTSTVFNAIRKAAESDVSITAEEVENLAYEFKELQKISSTFKPETFIKENKLSAKSGVGQELYKIGQNDKRMQALMDLESPVKVGGPAVTDFLKNIGEKYNLDKAGQLRAVKLIIDALGEQLVVEEKINDEAEKSTTQTASLSLLKQQLENRIAYKNALFEATSAEEYSLELQKEMLSVGEKDRVAAGYKLQALQEAKKLTLEQEKATVGALKDSDLINKKLESAGISGRIEPEKFAQLGTIAEKVSDLIKQQGSYTDDVASKTAGLVSQLGLNAEQQKIILDTIKETNGQIEKTLALESRLNALSNLRTATLEAEKFVNEKRSAAITNEYNQQSKAKELAKRKLDIELEAFKIQKERQKIGGGAGGNLSIDRQIVEKEKYVLQAKFNIDKEDLLIQVRKTLAEAALSVGLSPTQVKGLNLNQVTTKEEAVAKAKEIDEIEKNIKINKLEAAQKEFEKTITSSNYFYDKIINSADIFLAKIAGKQVDVNQPSASTTLQSGIFGAVKVATLAPTTVYPEDDLLKRGQAETNAQIQAIRNQESSSALADELGNQFDELGLSSDELVNQFGNLDNSLIQAGGSLTTFNNLIRDVFNNLPENMAQNQFAMLTATDSQSIIGNAVEARRNAILAQGPNDKSTIVAAADATAIYEKELEIKRAITAEDKINGEFELEKLKEILPLRMELLKAETNSEREAIIDRIIAKEKQRLPVLDRIKAAISSTAEQRTAELEDTLVSASVKFRDNLIDGISQAIEGGGSIKDILTSAALDFAREMTKASMKNFVGSIGGFFGFANGGIVPNMASGGMINGGSGSKDDVPAMLMGGEYVIKKKSVEKYGPEFLNAINNGRLNGYANGGKVSKYQDLYNAGQTGEGGFISPGLYGSANIVGKENLLAFATQSYTSGSRDKIYAGENYASIDFEPESLRMTQFGRLNNPLFQATQKDKEAAFGQYQEQLSQEADIARQVQQRKDEIKQREKALRRQLLTQAIIMVATAGMSAAANGFQAGWSQAGSVDGATFGSKFMGGLKGTVFGGNVQGVQTGGLQNLFTGVGKGLTGNFAEARNYFKLSQIGSAQELQEAYANQGNFSKFLENSGYVPKASIVNENGIGVNGGGGGGGIFDWARNLLGKGSNKDGGGFEATGEDIKPSLWERLTGRRNTIDPYAITEAERAELGDEYSYLYEGLPDPSKFVRPGTRRATGGSIPTTTGVDTVPAMLSGGEFIMNRAASQNIGAGNLQALNAGASSLPTEEKTEELNDKLISKLDELIKTTADQTGNINITVNSDGSNNQQESGEDMSKSKAQLAKAIKDTVLKVIQDEKRRGGILRN